MAKTFPIKLHAMVKYGLTYPHPRGFNVRLPVLDSCQLLSQTGLVANFA